MQGPLEDLVGDIEAFSQKAWGQAPNLARGQFQRSLLDIPMLDDLLSFTVLRAPTDLRLTKDGVPIPHEHYSRPVRFSNSQLVGNPEPVVVPELAITAFRNGCTLVFQGLQNHLPRLNEYCCILASSICHPVGANAYFSPDGANGKLHFDYHEVFIVQISGEKKWSVYESVAPNPTPSTSDQSVAIGAECLDETLSQGDVLYLPRGFWHLGQVVGDEPSLHLTLSVQARTLSDVLEGAVSDLQKSAEFRAPLPLGGKLDCEEKAELLDLMEASLSETLSAKLDAMKSEAKCFCNPKVKGALIAVASLDTLQTSSTFQPNYPQLWRMSEQAEVMEVALGQRSVVMPKAVAPIVEAIKSTDAVRPDDFIETHDEKIIGAVFRQLFRAGLIGRAEKIG